MLLRRICQLVGLRVSTRDYDYASKAATGKATFSADDIGDLLPRVKSNAPAHPLPEAKALIARSQQYLKSGDLQTAYYLAQEAQTSVHSVTGPDSVHMLECTEHLADVIQYASAKEDALTSVLLNSRNLDATVYLHGLDSSQAVTLHIKIADLLAATGEHKEALQHFLAAKYGLILGGGQDHPVHGELTRRIADLCLLGGLLDKNDVYRLLIKAREAAYNYPLKATIGLSIGRYLEENSAYEQAQQELTQSYKIMGQLFGEDDPKTGEAKSAMLAVKRKLVEAQVELRKSHRDQADKQRSALKAQAEQKAVQDADSKKQSEINSKRYKQALENARSRAGRR
jgi:hypothetical protein